jgi:pimeloyl-ACP methyl ester carboxylesterase
MPGCATPQRRADKIADAAGLRPLWLNGPRYRHYAYFRDQAESHRLWVFIDGDGSPWIEGGTQVASDPTPRNPLALNLAARTPGAVLYLARPCYFTAHTDAACTPRAWTDGRFGVDVVDSLTAVLSEFMRGHDVRDVVLVGYSGGGTLAVLMAPRLAAAVTPDGVSHRSTTVVAVVTVAGNLDTDQWTAMHAYQPLSASLNPALAPPIPDDIRQVHLVGALDSNVPPVAMTRYLSQVPARQVWAFADFDHRCCWVEQWPHVLARLQRELAP